MITSKKFYHLALFLSQRKFLFQLLGWSWNWKRKHFRFYATQMSSLVGWERWEEQFPVPSFKSSWVGLDVMELCCSLWQCAVQGDRRKGSSGTHSYRTGSGWRSACHLRVLFLFSVVTRHGTLPLSLFTHMTVHTHTHSHLNKTSGVSCRAEHVWLE